MNAPNRKRESVLVALVHEALNAETFDSLADLCDVVKTRAARLRIPYDTTTITNALHVAGQTRPLVRETLPRLTPPPVEAPPVPPVPPDVAARLVHELRRRLKAGPKGMPPVKRTTRTRADALTAFAMVTRAMRDSIDRCEALEREVDA